MRIGMGMIMFLGVIDMLGKSVSGDGGMGERISRA